MKRKIRFLIVHQNHIRIVLIACEFDKMDFIMFHKISNHFIINKKQITFIECKNYSIFICSLRYKIEKKTVHSLFPRYNSQFPHTFCMFFFH